MNCFSLVVVLTNIAKHRLLQSIDYCKASIIAKHRLTFGLTRVGGGWMPPLLKDFKIFEKEHLL